MKNASLAAVLAATVLVPALPGATLAGDCQRMRAAEPEDTIFTCRLSYTRGGADVTRTRCFLSADEGFRWMQRESGRATGHIRQGNCRHQGRTMRYRDWLRQQG